MSNSSMKRKAPALLICVVLFWLDLVGAPAWAAAPEGFIQLGVSYRYLRCPASLTSPVGYIGVQNTGGGDLHWKAIARTTGDLDWLRVSPDSGTLAPYSKVFVETWMEGGTLPARRYAGTIRFQGNAPTSPEVEIDAEVVRDNAINIWPSVADFFLNAGDAATVTNRLVNFGPDLLPFQAVVAASNQTWLSVSPASGVLGNKLYVNDFTNLAVSVDSSLLQTGTYRAVITVTAPTLRINSPGVTNINVWLTVRASTNTPPNAMTNVISLGERLRLPGFFDPVSTNHVKIQFSRSADGTDYMVEAPIETLTATTATLRVPVNLLGRNDTMPVAASFNSNVTVRVITGLPQNPQTNVLPAFRLVLPRLLVHDEVFVPPAVPARVALQGVFVPPALPAGAAPQVPTTPGTLLQFLLNNPTNVNDPATVATFMFLGQSTDGRTGLRTLNTALGALAGARPVRLPDQVKVFQPVLAGSGFDAVLPFHIPNQAPGDEGLQFDVLRDGPYVIVVESDVASPGPFPAPFQVHLAGNVGLPRKLINGLPEFPRGTRLDTLFNHPAPRLQALAATPVGSAETAPYKFASLASASPFAVAVLIPTAPDGFLPGTPVVRAPDPVQPIEVTTPTARTPGNTGPALGMVIDFTQLPDPASVVSAPPLTETVGAVIGRNDGQGVTLPLTVTGGAVISSLILDMGSGQEIADGSGADFKVFATAGSFTVAVANTPYTGSWAPVTGTFSGSSDLDLNGTGLLMARYVRITAAPTVTLDAVQKLNFLCDQVDSQIGPVTRVYSATILARRAKGPETPLDPFLQLIAPNGELYGENESGFGDDLSLDQSDSALVRISLPAVSFYRYLVKGYDKVPDAQAVGTFFTRLETDGNYDSIELAVSPLSEVIATAQKQGKIDRTRQRDSYLFQANPGARLHIAANALTAGLDPVVELYDPEDFLIGANDNAPNRGRNALLSVTLPTLNGAPLPIPSTYRIVVQAADILGNPQVTALGMAYPRIAPSGNYELKVFSGDISTNPLTPVILALQPANGAPGTVLIIQGSGFSSIPANNTVRFGGQLAVVSTVSSTELRVAVPSGLTVGPVAVTVTVGGQTSVAASFTVTADNPEPSLRQALAAMYGLSLRFHPVTVQAGDVALTLELDGTLGPAPNGELYPLFEESGPTHASGFVLTGASFPEPLLGELTLNVPMDADTNLNGIPDFFEASQTVSNTRTQGEYTTDMDLGTVNAVWNRPAGTGTGTCRLILTSATTGAFPEFPATFELLEYRGELTYRPGTNRIDGSLALTRVSAPKDTLAGPVSLRRVATNRLEMLALDAGQWTNANSQAWICEPTMLTHHATSKRLYIGRLSAKDGDLTTTAEDYYDWLLVFEDPNDADGNGIPDLSDDPPTGPIESPRITATADAAKTVLSLSIDGRIGQSLRIEFTAALGRDSWSTHSTVTLTRTPQSVELPLGATPRFYRLKVP